MRVRFFKVIVRCSGIDWREPMFEVARFNYVVQLSTVRALFDVSFIAAVPIG